MRLKPLLLVALVGGCASNGPSLGAIQNECGYNTHLNRAGRASGLALPMAAGPMPTCGNTMFQWEMWPPNGLQLGV
jgi:hypothetical protein